MTSRRIVFNGKQEVHLEELDLSPIACDQVRIKTRYSLMSTGTENIVFNRLFDPGTHWDNWVQYPFYPGYSAVGEVAETGQSVDGFPIGSLVAARIGHTSDYNAHPSQLVLLPADIDPQLAAWFALAKIAFMGARAAKYQIGDTLLIIGAGPIGQMSVRWARAAGVAKIVVVDPVESRLALAVRGGATATISKSVADCKEDVMAALDGQLPRVVNDATGNPTVFAAALGLAARFGRVVLLGDSGTPSGQHLTSDVIMRGLTIVGAHDGHDDDQWNSNTITKLFVELLQSGRFDLTGLNTHFFKPEQAVEAYETANTRRGETMGILFDWTQS